MWLGDAVELDLRMFTPPAGRERPALQ
jgi:hypothetical protein